ncbi:MAG TPA: amino acid ABC transporter substrate-binding protein [Candidatus Scatomonas merdavium]|nr:amino acid ABC transporter substrate-binding protein [Candidatus Scatomonas merdavium]
MKKSKKFVAVAAAAVMAAGMLAGCGGGGGSASGEGSDNGAAYLEGIKSEGTLVVGCDPTIEGVCYLDPESGEITGFIPEIINGFAEELGVTVDWETLEWSAMLTAVNSGKVDMIAANMNMTLERASQITFSDPYFVDHGKGCVTQDSPYQSLDDLQGQSVKIGVTEGSAYEELIPELFPEAETVTLSAGTWQDALSSGIIDVAFDDGVVFAGPLNVNENLRLLDGNGPSYLNGVAFAQGNYVMKDVFDLYIQRLKVNGDYAAIYQQYMGTEWVPETTVSAY